MQEALIHTCKNYAWITSCILHALLMIALFTTLLNTVSLITDKSKDTNRSTQEEITPIEYMDFDEPPATPQQQQQDSANTTPPLQTQQAEPAPAVAVPTPQLTDRIQEPEQPAQDTEQKTVSIKRPPRRAKSAWIKQKPSSPQQGAPTQSSAAQAGQRLAQQFNSYMQEKEAKKGSVQAQDVALAAYSKRILKSLCDATRYYEKSVVLHQKIQERIRCTVTINQDGKILKVALDPSTGSIDMDKAIEGLCRSSAIPKIPTTLSINNFDFTVYFMLRQSKNGLNIVRFYPSA